MRIFRIGVISLCVIFTLSYSVTADEILSWEDCVLEANANHPDLISYKAQLKQSLSTKWKILSSALPQLSSSISATTAQTSTIKRRETYTYSVAADQLLFDAKIIPKIKSANADIEAAQHNYDLTSSKVRNRLRVAFVQLWNAQELLTITTEIYQRRKQNFDLVQLRYEAGREHKGSLLTSEANFIDAKLEIDQAKRNLTIAQRRLVKELGRKNFSEIHIQGDLALNPNLPDKPDFDIVASQTPFLKQLIATTNQAEHNLRYYRNDFYPTVNFNSGIGRTGYEWPPIRDYWSYGVSVSLPFFEGGARIADAQNAKATLEQKQAEQQSGRDQLLLALEQDWASYQDAIDEVTVKEKFLEASQERSKIAEAQYSQGLLSFDNWIIIEDDLVSAKKNFLTAQEQALIAQANWVLTLGGTLDDEK